MCHVATKLHTSPVGRGGGASTTWHPCLWWRGMADRRHVVCRSERASARHHKTILFGGTMGAFRLCSDKRLEQLRTFREHSVKLTPCLFLSGTGTGGRQRRKGVTMQHTRVQVRRGAVAKKIAILFCGCRFCERHTAKN